MKINLCVRVSSNPVYIYVVAAAKTLVKWQKIMRTLLPFLGRSKILRTLLPQGVSLVIYDVFLPFKA